MMDDDKDRDNENPKKTTLAEEKEKELRLSSSTLGDDNNHLDSIKSSTLEISPSMTMDYRILWIRDKVMKFLCLDDSYKYLFNQLIDVSKNFLQFKKKKTLHEFIIIE